jgi:ech hydrogenase subunit D
MIEKEVQSIDAVEVSRLLNEVDALRGAGWRLVQVLAVADAEGVELTYSFGLSLALKGLRMRVPAGAAVPSITALYPAAFLYENEIRDLFGVDIERIAGDWMGKVYDVAGDKPFSKVTIKAISSEQGVASAGGRD